MPINQTETLTLYFNWEKNICIFAEIGVYLNYTRILLYYEY